MAISPNIHDRDKAAYKENSNDGGLDRRVTDVTSQQKLDAIITALGGSSDTTATIFNVSATIAGTEYNQALPANCKSFVIKARNRSTVRLAFSNGDTNTVYLTLKPGVSYEDKNFYSNQTLYFQADKPNEIIEILAYT